MDVQIRHLLTAAKKHGAGKGGPSLQKAYDLLRNVAETRLAVDTPEAFGQDLYIICAEIAFQHGQREMAKECLKMYFMKTPPSNQFLCRAYLCQAQLLAPTSADNPDQLGKAVLYLIKAINMSKENPRYHFLVYNASVLYWQFCRPFLKPAYRQYLARSLHQVVKALDDIDDKDYEWRAQLMIALIECHMDAGRRSDASHIATAAASFIKQHVPNLYKTVFGLMVRHQLVDPAKLQKDIKASPELNIYHKICRLKFAIDQQDPEKEVAEEMRRILNAMNGQDTDSTTSISKPSTAKERGRRSTTPEEKDAGSLSECSLRSSCSSSSLSEEEDAIYECNKDSRPILLMELARLALEQNIPDVATRCVDMIKECAHLVKEPGFLLELEFVQCELMVKVLGDHQESYHKAVIEVRQQAIKRCEEAIVNAVRLSAPHVIQAGCVTQWNLCLPLLQPNLRQQVRRPLTVVAEALEDIQSLLMLLRCQVHMELAKCEEDQEQIQGAMTHLKKALALDDGNVYEERLQVALHRLELRSELYTQPERAEDQAAMIIEQARKADSGTTRMKRSLLVRAGEALAPDAFLLVLDSESDTKEVTSGKGPTTAVSKLGGRARNFTKGIKKAAGHLRRRGDENDRERARLWGDLAKTARKQEVWDVCRVAARFCLLHDDGRWKNEPPIKDSPRKEEDVSKPGKDKSEQELARDKSSSKMAKDKDKEKDKESGPGSRAASPEPQVPLYDKDLIRMLAEVNFIQGESLIHLLRTEGVELGEIPNPPEDKRLRPKGYIAKKPEEDPDWIEYCDWVRSLTSEAVTSFLRAVELGVELVEPWIVCSASAYLWNYNNHVLSEGRYSKITDSLTALLTGLKKVGHAGETILLVNICNALAQGLLGPWMPEPTPKDSVVPTTDEAPVRGSAKKKGAAPAAAGAKKPAQVTISPDAQPDLKKAVEVCEYAMKVTNGDRAADLVPVSVRQPLLQTWVLAKQMLQAQVSKGLGVDDETNNEGQNPMTRAMVAVELIQLSGNGIMEFKEAPAITAAVELVAGCNWTDKLVELQLWTRLAHLAYENKDHATVQRCTGSALAFAVSGTQSKKTARRGDRDKHKYTVEQELLAHASSLYGQSLVDTAHGKNSVRRNAMKQFLNAAKFACAAGNGALVMQVARLYWNASLALLTQPIERELLMEPLTTLLHCINITTDKKAFKRDEDEGGADADTSKTSGGSGEGPAAAGAPANSSEGALKPVGVIGGPEDDLTLRAALYGVLFQSYADKGEWEAGLKAMDQAIADMPRTNHRLLIFKHMVTVKAKLGLNVSMSIQKFKDENEHYVAHMWRRVALCSKDPVEQLQAYQYAIEALGSPESDWQKFDYLLEFGQWLFCNEFPVQDALDQLEWAADILLNFKYESDIKDDILMLGSDDREDSSDSLFKGKKGAKGKGKEKTKSPPPSAKPPPPSAKPPPTSKSKDKGTPDARSVSGSDTDINASDYIPVHKEVIIDDPESLIPADPSLTVSTLRHVRQLEGLVRSHVMMAQVAGKGSMYHADYVIMAYGYVMRIWQSAVGGCGATLKEIAKNPVQASDAASKGGSAKGKAPAKGAKPEVVKEKPKRKGPLDAVPSTVDEWAGYDVPDEVLDAFKHEMMKDTGINKQTITKPALTLHYLDQLVASLRALGYHHLALPVLALAEVVTRHLLKNRPLTALVHLRSQEVCVELNLLTAACFHDKLADYAINEEEQARSREEMALWKERQVQVAKEEARLREAMAQETGQNKTKKKKTDLALVDKEPSTPASPHLGKQVGLISLQEVWTDTAEVLIRQALYQPARQMLSEAYQAAQAFSDAPLQARVLLLLGKLSYIEAQYGQAVNFASQAQKAYDGDEEFWYETVMLMVDATVDDYSLKDGSRLISQLKCKTFRHGEEARGMLVHALNVFSNLAEMRPNKVSIIGYIVAKLEAKLGSIQARLAFAEHDNILKPKVLAALESARGKMKRASEQLVRLGYKREAAAVCKENADILARLARRATSIQDQREYYLQALGMYEEGRRLAEEILHDALTTSSLIDLKGASPPVQREYAEMTLVSCSFMLEILALHGREQRNMQRLEQRKNSIVRVVEELIRETPDYTDSEREWIETNRSLGEVVLAHLTAVHSMVLNVPHLKCKSLCLIGGCLRIICEQRSPDPPSQWRAIDSSTLNVAEHLDKQTTPSGGDVENQEEGTPRSVPESLPDPNSRQYQRYEQLIVKLKDSLGTCHHFLSQATDVLCQALSIALNSSFMAEASDAALELVECIGQYDPGLSSQFLALHQSCAASCHMDGLLQKALVDPKLSQQAALYHQRRVLESNTAANGRHSPVYKTVLDSLNETSHAWKRLGVSPTHLDLLKDFTPNTNFVVLQHSPDRHYLYGALLDKPKASAAAAGKGQKQASLQSSSKARLVRLDTSPERLDELLGRFRWWKHDIMQVLLKAEYQRSQAAQRMKMLENLDESIKAGAQELSRLNKSFNDGGLRILSSKLRYAMKPHFVAAEEEAMEDEETPLEEEFLRLVQTLEDYLRPITSLLDASLRPSSATTVSNDKPAGKNDPPPNSEYLIVLADQWLLQLPLEALGCFQTEAFVSLSRDISLQFLHHKFVQEQLDEAAEKAKKEKEKVKPPTRLPGLRDAAKKQAKIIPLERKVPDGHLPVDTHGFRYFVDPSLDCAETEVNAPIEQFEKLLEVHEQQFTPRWLGVMGTEHTPSTGEYEIYIMESSALIFYGMERFLCQLPPHKVAALNLTDCQMVMLFDMAQTNKSFLRQSKVDVLKTSDVLALEKPVETALLLGLTGINCVCLNQWHCTLQENATKIKDTMKDMLAEGQTTGQTIRMLFTPYRRKVEEEPEEETAAIETESTKSKGKEKDKDTQSNQGKTESQAEDVASQPAEPELEPEPIPKREWYNMVCYGAPNIIVTQIGKV